MSIYMHTFQHSALQSVLAALNLLSVGNPMQ